jgi:hypothetical protein
MMYVVLFVIRVGCLICLFAPGLPLYARCLAAMTLAAIWHDGDRA